MKLKYKPKQTFYIICKKTSRNVCHDGNLRDYYKGEKYNAYIEDTPSNYSIWVWTNDNKGLRFMLNKEDEDKCKYFYDYFIDYLSYLREMKLKRILNGR